MAHICHVNPYSLFFTKYFDLEIKFLITGKSGNKEVCADEKFKEDGDPWSVEAQAAFLGPILWDKTLPYDADLKVPQVCITPHIPLPK